MPDQAELVASCMRMVQRLARQCAAQYSNASLEDLASEGYIGLVQAAQKFQPRRGVRFSTYAAPRIRGAMLDFLRRDSPLSRPMANRVARLKSEQDQLSAHLGRNPTQEELAHEMHLSPQKASEALGLRSLRVTSLEAQASHVVARLSDGAASPEELAIGRMITRELQHYLARLQPLDREVIERIYWWHQKHVEVAADLGISASRVSQRRSRALKQLREMIAADGRQAAHFLQVA